MLDALALQSAALESERPAWLSRRLFPFTSRFVAVEGTRFHYVDEGNGPPLLFLHGGPMSSFMWRHTIGSLRREYRCVAVDLPGLGLSRTELVPGRGFAHMADALQAFVRRLGLDAFTLIVHATGGPSGLEMAIRERARLRGLVISNTFAWPLATDPDAAARKMRTMARIVSSSLFRFLVVRLNLLPRIAAGRGRSGGFDPEEREAVLGPYHDLEARRHLANLLYGLRVESSFFARLRDRMPNLANLRTLLVFGERDNGYTCGFLSRFEAMLPSHTSVVLPNAAHFLTEDAPKAYTAALDRWLA
jgi:haloalkane dehalogenase